MKATTTSSPKELGEKSWRKRKIIIIIITKVWHVEEGDGRAGAEGGGEEGKQPLRVLPTPTNKLRKTAGQVWSCCIEAAYPSPCSSRQRLIPFSSAHFLSLSLSLPPSPSALRRQLATGKCFRGHSLTICYGGSAVAHAPSLLCASAPVSCLPTPPPAPQPMLCTDEWAWQ